MLPARGPWPHSYFETTDAFVDVAFDDTAGKRRAIRTRYKVLGDEKSPPLVLVHGLMSSSYSWRYVLAPLAERYRVFAPDLVGTGDSDKPLDLVYSLANVARHLIGFVRKVAMRDGEGVYLVGNSLGGLYCIEALLRDATFARRFVLMHAPGYPILRARLGGAILNAPGVGAVMREVVARVAHTMPKTFVRKNVHYEHDEMLTDEECVEHGRMFETMAKARAFPRILAQSLDQREHAAVIAEMKERGLPCPVKILFAREDVMVPPEFGPRFHADIPGSEFVVMDDASHFLHVDAPERTVKEIVAFDA